MSFEKETRKIVSVGMLNFQDNLERELYGKVSRPYGIWTRLAGTDIIIKSSDLINKESEFEAVRAYDEVRKCNMYIPTKLLTFAPPAMRILYGLKEDEECYIYS